MPYRRTIMLVEDDPEIRELTAADQQGGTSTFRFTNLRENTGLSDARFTFKIPRGADVIDADSSAR